ncbi:MAG: hypothetical protein LBK69_03415, partial [Syntrophomonadaceae bacterium]|nr:hypothetical protein [Syntrophomonadaceae bacterium]
MTDEFQTQKLKKRRNYQMKKKFSAKLLSILLTMAMVLPLMPLPSFALAAEPQVENSAGAAAEESGAASGDGAEAPQSGSATLDAANATPGASGLQPMAAIDQVKVTQRDFELWNVHVEDYQRPNFYLNY